jgi:hypothetical protein
MSQADEDAIREIENQFNVAWNRHDPDAIAASLSSARRVQVESAHTPGTDPGLRNAYRPCVKKTFSGTRRSLAAPISLIASLPPWARPEATSSRTILTLP